MTVTYKDLKKVKNQLGQFMTPDVISQTIVDRENYTGIIIEPSFGLGSFLYKLECKYVNAQIIGIEYDPDLFSKYTGQSTVHNESFYQFQLDEQTKADYITFVGNPPYRTPAFSLKSDDSGIVKALVKKYKLTGVKEEAVFFIAHAVDIIKSRNVPGMIHFVLPRTIFENSGAAFKNFRKFLDKHAPVTEIIDISEMYPGVSQPLCIVKFLINQKTTVNLTQSRVLSDTIEFQKIFKRTYLGSVPCESILLSNRDEPLDNFKLRLENIFQKNISLKDGLKFNNKYHLRALSSASATEKFNILENYVTEIKQKFDISEFSNVNNYKPIAHRSEVRWYFRNTGLKVSFIYLLNSNPCPSFYFPGNPTKTSTDYFGFCDYDCNRNSSPGANRLVPLANVEDNVTDEFKEYWNNNTSEPITEIFNYISYIAKSAWYKEYKSKYQRFYFGLPKQFDKSWIPLSNKSETIWTDTLTTLTSDEIRFNSLFGEI